MLEIVGYLKEEAQQLKEDVRELDSENERLSHNLLGHIFGKLRVEARPYWKYQHIGDTLMEMGYVEKTKRNKYIVPNKHTQRVTELLESMFGYYLNKINSE